MFGLLFLCLLSKEPILGGEQNEKFKAPIKSQDVIATDGKILASQVCGACHLCPDPSVVDKKCWREQILPRMETRLGVSPPDYNSSPEGALIRELKIYPEQPLITQAQWDAIVDYYVTAAPEKVCGIIRGYVGLRMMQLVA